MERNRLPKATVILFLDHHLPKNNMKRLLSVFIFITGFTTTNAQDLTGIWSGTFYTNKFEQMFGSNNRYELQLDNVGRMAKGVTYSYTPNGFYGKSSIVGMWTPDTKNIIFKENKLLDYKEADSNTVIMFTCYLEYRKEGDKEILEGEYSGEFNKSHKPAQGGKIYLEKTTITAFKKEDFILRKERADSTKKKFMPDDMAKKIPLKKKTLTKKEDPIINAKPKVKISTPVVKNKPQTQQPAKPKQNNVTKTTPQILPKSKPAIAAKPKVAVPKPVEKPNLATAPPTQNPTLKPVDPETITIGQPKKLAPPIEVPKVLKERTNELFKTIPVHSNEIEVNFYDNGEIDGDTISVYLNGRLLASHRGLTTEPITFKIKIDDDNPDQEIVMVAENLGTISPNTALMIVKVGGKRYDVNLSSNEQKNAMVKFKYLKE